MRSLVIVRTEAPDRYTAQVVGIPEIRAVAATEAEAVAEVRQSLASWLSSAKLVQVEIPTENPWLKGAGMFKDDPLFDVWQEAIAENRRQADADPNVL